MTGPSNLGNKLTVAQLFRLGILCEECDEAVCKPPPQTKAEIEDSVRTWSGLTTGVAPIARYLFDEGVSWDDFSPDDIENYRRAYMASVMVSCPQDFPPGSLGHDILIAAGIRSKNPSTWPVEENEVDGEVDE